MKFSVIAAAQRSPEWFAARAGRLTGSCAANVLANIKSGEAAARRDYRLQLATERLTGAPQQNDFISAEMQRGIDLEATAFAAFEAVSGEMVRRTGFICADELMVGCSLDGDSNNFEGIVELKCPKSTTHVSYWKAGEVPSNHIPQLTHNMWVTGAKYCDFASYDDRLPAHLHLFTVRVHARDLPIAEYEVEALKFLSEVEAEVEALRNLGKLEQAA